MTATTIAPVTVADLHAGFGCCNRASVEAPGHWQARAAELLSEKHSADVAAAIVARVTASQAFLNEGPCPWAYEGHGGAMNVQPSLFAAAAVCALDADTGCFDRAELEALAWEPEGNDVSQQLQTQDPFSNITAWIATPEDAAQLAALMTANARQYLGLAEPLLALAAAFNEQARALASGEEF